MRFTLPETIRSDFDGFNGMINFQDKTKGLFLTKLELDFKKTTWFEANLLAVLGALLSNIQNGLNTVEIVNLNNSLKKLFRRNHFLSNFGDYIIQDTYGTTVKYKKFKITDEKYFKTYLDDELLSKKAMPDMSKELRKKINESIFEIFNNAIIHGKCEEIFTCGQYYPTMKKLDLTIVDLGVSIQKNVTDFLRKNVSGKESIKWALTEGNTTRTGSIPGGLGLKLISKFLKLNEGKIQIVSADGYYEQKANESVFQSFPSSFPGTIVNLEFKIDNRSYYYLTKVKAEDIF